MTTKQSSKIKNEYDDNFAFHPWNVMLMLALFAIGGLFLATCVAFIYNRIEQGVEPIKIPWLFAFNTIILLASSWTMITAKKAYLADNTKAYQNALLFTIGLTFIFLVMQIIAWNQLFSQDIFLNPANNGANYLYLLSGLHFAHVVVGLPFLILFYRTAILQMKEPVTVLVYFSDPEKRLKLRLLSIYWHFLDALWIFLVVFLLANYLIQ